MIAFQYVSRQGGLPTTKEETPPGLHPSLPPAQCHASRLRTKSGGAGATKAERLSNGQQVLLFRLAHFIDLLDLVVGELLELGLRAV